MFGTNWHRVRALFKAWLIGWCLSVCGSAAADERFSLSATLLQPQKTNAPLRVAIELRNVSGQPQRVVTLTNFFRGGHLFEGRVYLRDVAGDVHEFMQSNYWKMMLSGTWQAPTVELAPGGSHRWELSLSDFIDSQRGRVFTGYPILSAEFQPGCEMWCALDIKQWKKLDGGRTKKEQTAIAVSSSLSFPRVRSEVGDKGSD